MKNKSSFITTAISLVFWLSLAAVFVMGVLFVFLNLQDTQTKFTIKWKLDQVVNLEPTSIQIISKHPNTAATKVGTDQLALSFSTTDSVWRSVTSVYLLVLSGFVLVVTFLLRQIARSVERGQTFSIANRNRIRWLGLLTILTVPVELIGKMLMIWLIHHYFQVSAPELPLAVMFPPDLAYQNIFFGLVILLIAEVFQQGLAMKSENELTI